MISRSFRVALSALLFVGALGLASTGPVQAQSIMKQCGDEWKAAKENNTTNGMKWPEFLKQCRVQKEGAAAPAAAPVAAPAPAPLPLRRAGPDLSAEAETHAGRSPDGRGRIRLGSASQGALPRRHGGLGQHQGQVPHLPLLGLAAGTARRSRAPICARPTLAPRAITRRRARRNSRSRCSRKRRQAAQNSRASFGIVGRRSVHVECARRISERWGSRRCCARKAQNARLRQRKGLAAIFRRARSAAASRRSCTLSANWVKRRRL